MRPAVINASPLIILGRAGYLDLLPKLFSSVSAPHAVAEEILAGPTEEYFADILTGKGWLSVVDVGEISSPLASARLGRGETAVLEYVRTHPGSVAVLDDKAARRSAAVLGIPLTGTLGVLTAAVQAGHLPDFVVAAGKAVNAGLYIDPATVSAIAGKLRMRDGNRPG